MRSAPLSNSCNVAWCLGIFRLRYLFLPAFSLAPALLDTDAGDAFVVPGRLNDAFVALVDAGLDLTIDPSITHLARWPWPSVLLSRIKVTVSKLVALLLLSANGLVDVKESDDDDEMMMPTLSGRR